MLGLCLEAVGRSDIRSQLAYCLHELASNAKRANTKRAYFAAHGLDLTNPAEYAVGMERFREGMIEDTEYYLQKQRLMGLRITFRFSRCTDGLVIEVRNNAPATRP